MSIGTTKIKNLFVLFFNNSPCGIVTIHTGSLGSPGLALFRTGRITRGRVLTGVWVGATGRYLGTSSWSLTPGVGGIASDSGKGTGVTLGITLATGSSATSFARLRTWSWCRRMTVPLSSWIRPDTGPVFSTTVPGIQAFLYRNP